MRQQINLYQPVFSAERKPLSSRTVSLVLGSLIVLLAASAFVAHSQRQSLRTTVAAMRTEVSNQQAAHDENSRAGQPELTELQAQNASLERRVNERRTALEVLRSGAAGQPQGFAARMEALARRHVEGLWIDKLVLSGTNGSMSLSGGTLDADTVPKYLQSLAGDPVLQGTRFDEFLIERPAPLVAKTDDEDSTAKLSTAQTPRHIRFRAGNKDLIAPPRTAVEPAT